MNTRSQQFAFGCLWLGLAIFFEWDICLQALCGRMPWHHTLCQAWLSGRFCVIVRASVASAGCTTVFEYRRCTGNHMADHNSQVQPKGPFSVKKPLCSLYCDDIRSDYCSYPCVITQRKHDQAKDRSERS